MLWDHAFQPFSILTFSSFPSPSLQTCWIPFKTSNETLLLVYPFPLMFSPCLQASPQAASTSLKTFYLRLDRLFTSHFPKHCLYTIDNVFYLLGLQAEIVAWPSAFPFYNICLFPPPHQLQRKCMLLSFPNFPKRRLSILPWFNYIQGEPASLNVCMIC